MTSAVGRVWGKQTGEKDRLREYVDGKPPIFSRSQGQGPLEKIGIAFKNHIQLLPSPRLSYGLSKHYADALDGMTHSVPATGRPSADDEGRPADVLPGLDGAAHVIGHLQKREQKTEGTLHEADSLEGCV